MTPRLVAIDPHSVVRLPLQFFPLELMNLGNPSSVHYGKQF